LRYQFPSSARLRKRREFLVVQGEGKKVHTRHFLVLVSREGTGRVGITVSKKVGNAVIRNRVKRLVREFVRQARWDDGAWVPAGRDLVIVAKRSAAEIDFAELSRDLMAERERVASC
jgi:ribonuclease P protein component